MNEKELVLKSKDEALIKAFLICEKCESLKECEAQREDGFPISFLNRIMAGCGKWKGLNLQPFREKIRKVNTLRRVIDDLLNDSVDENVVKLCKKCKEYREDEEKGWFCALNKKPMRKGGFLYCNHSKLKGSKEKEGFLRCPFCNYPVKLVKETNAIWKCENCGNNYDSATIERSYWKEINPKKLEEWDTMYPKGDGRSKELSVQTDQHSKSEHDSKSYEYEENGYTIRTRKKRPDLLDEVLGTKPKDHRKREVKNKSFGEIDE